MRKARRKTEVAIPTVVKTSKPLELNPDCRADTLHVPYMFKL